MDVQAEAAALRARIAALSRRDTPSIRALRKMVSSELKTAPAAEVIALAQAFEHAAAQEGKWVAYELIRFHPSAFAAAGEPQVEAFAGRVSSWYAVDAFGTVLAGPLWAAGRISDGFVEAWTRAPDRWLRRLALVATVGLNGSVRASGDPARTFPICLQLASDRDDMVEKAVSWALRYLSQKDRPAVVAFMAEHGERFRARVRREVRSKLETGLKAPSARPN